MSRLTVWSNEWSSSFLFLGDVFFNADLSIRRLDSKQNLKGVPLPGVSTLSIAKPERRSARARDGATENDQLHADGEDAEKSATLEIVTTMNELEAIARDSGDAFDVATHRSYSFTARFEHKYPDDKTEQHKGELA
ncbi:hypothetical protein JCM8547_002353 [Rhodosporidiobolus lusitaniae]